MEGFAISFTKFFDVKSPIGIKQREKEDNSIGIDLYMPAPSKEFFDVLLEVNKKLFFKLNIDLKIDDIDGFINLIDQYYSVVLSYDKRENIYRIYRNIQIPTGIGLLLPDGYHLVIRSKSSNYFNGYTSIEGLIDNNYTYGMGLQLLKFDDDQINLKPNEKIAQILLEKDYPIFNLIEIKSEDWENSPTVINKREQRVGGFGSTGKFDK